MSVAFHTDSDTRELIHSFVHTTKNRSNLQMYNYSKKRKQRVSGFYNHSPRAEGSISDGNCVHSITDPDLTCDNDSVPPNNSTAPLSPIRLTNTATL
jgi:hypothetical protein